ncbi:promotilin [Budorcas taxicolor]|uniref:promotilin n=1 Tax=Budorcas taxicolor TaxID=37181 RepID=UPI00228475BC|nr:promotilin [Budorcas taxicolor]
MLSRKATAILLVVHAAAMLASQTEGFVPIFTYGEVQRMQEKERYKGQKKSLSVQQRSEEGPADPAEPREDRQEVIELTAPVEIGMRMNSRQLEKYQATLEGLLRKVLPSSRNEAPEPARCTPPQFPTHVLINPSTAARSREALPRQPLKNGESGLQQGTSEVTHSEKQEKKRLPFSSSLFRAFPSPSAGVRPDSEPILPRHQQGAPNSGASVPTPSGGFSRSS